MSTTSRNNHSNRSSRSAPSLALIGGLLALCLMLIGLPALLIGFSAQRVSRRIPIWRIRFLLWFLLAAISAFLLYQQYDQVKHMIVQELLDYIHTIRLHQTNLAQWNIKALWAETWPVWMHTLLAVPLVGFWQEMVYEPRTDTTSRLKHNERRRQQKIVQAQRRAKRKARRPDRVPDTLGGEMVIGIPIENQEEE